MWEHPVMQALLVHRHLHMPRAEDVRPLGGQSWRELYFAFEVRRKAGSGGWVEDGWAQICEGNSTEGCHLTLDEQESWLDWALAGYNTEEACLVGIEGAVYDLTSFLPHHPGSRETIVVNAGTDATTFFEDVGHSHQARALMQVSDCCERSL
jgi:cytochrome-b5 reductase